MAAQVVSSVLKRGFDQFKPCRTLCTKTRKCAEQEGGPALYGQLRIIAHSIC